MYVLDRYCWWPYILVQDAGMQHPCECFEEHANVYNYLIAVF